MGLLSSTQETLPKHWLQPLQRHFCLISAVFFVVGLAWFSLLAYKPYNAGTYFSENALLPGLVQGQYSEEKLAQDYLRLLETEAQRYPSSIPHVFIAAQFRQLGLDSYTHNFTMQNPLKAQEFYTGKNIYGIFRAPRGSGTECIVVSIPYRFPDSVFTPTRPGLALIWSLIHTLKRGVHWAKDIIFLVTEHEQLGMQAWLEAYHQLGDKGEHVLRTGQLEARAGAIQALVNLEFSEEKISHMDIRMEGLNGQLPNLDLVNLVHRLASMERFTTTVRDREDADDPLHFSGWLHSMKTLLSMIGGQATGVPSGNHGLAHRFGIEAITVASSKKRGSYAHGFHQQGRVLEGILRSLNNLQERFHQSFFFYLLPATHRYVSIGVYFPPFACLLVPILLQVLLLWLQEGSWPLAKLFPVLGLSLLGGGAVNKAPVWASSLARWWDVSTEAAVMGSTALLAVFVAIVLKIWAPKYLNRNHVHWGPLYGSSLLLLATLSVATAMCNFSLALIITVFITPVLCILKPRKSRIGSGLVSFACFLIHPLSLLMAATLFDTWLTFGDDSWLQILGRSWWAAQRALVYAVVDHFVYGNWLHSLACLTYLPLWHLLWVSVSLRKETALENVNKKSN